MTNFRKKIRKKLTESQGKLEKSQGKVREKSGNSVSKIWQTPCIVMFILMRHFMKQLRNV